MDVLDLLYGVLPIIGVIVGAPITNRLSKSSEELKHRRSIRAKTYADYLQAVGRLAIAQKNGDKVKEQDFLALATDSKTRIFVYSGMDVIKAMADLDRVGAKLNNKKISRRIYECNSRNAKRQLT